MTMDNYYRDSRSISRLNNLEASNVDFGGVFTEQLHRSYDIGIAGQYKSISSNICLKMEFNLSMVMREVSKFSTLIP